MPFFPPTTSFSVVLAVLGLVAYFLFPVEYKPDMSWWVRELRVLASFEAFVTELYQASAKQLIVSIVPSKLIPYNSFLYIRAFFSLFFSSFLHIFLDLKIFALSALVASAYVGLAPPRLSTCRSKVRCVWFKDGYSIFNAGRFIATLRDTFNGTITTASFSATHQVGIWDVDRAHARTKLHPGKLKDQMFGHVHRDRIAFPVGMVRCF